MALLEKINSPADLKEISRDDLPELAEEIRWAIVDVVSQNTGIDGCTQRVDIMHDKILQLRVFIDKFCEKSISQ